MKDQLYLLRPGFFNAGLGPLYCGDSLPIEGMLSFFPQLRTLLDVHYLEFPRPARHSSVHSEKNFREFRYSSWQTGGKLRTRN